MSNGGVFKGIGHKREFVLAFFIGSAVSAIAFDFSDFLFYSTSATGALNAEQQAWLFAIFPTLYYAGFVILGYLLFRYTRVSPVFLLYLYGASIVIALYLTFSLPQASGSFFLSVALTGAAVSLGSIWALKTRLGSR